MGPNIDDLVDDRTLGIQSVGESYYDQFLLKRPKTEWSPYIDETAQDLSSGIQIGDLTLGKDDFGPELGTYYRRGLKKTAGRYTDLPSVLENKVDDRKLGLLAYQLNELSYDISTTNRGIDNVEKATEAVIGKLLTRHVGNELDFSFNLSGGAVSDIVTELFKNETIAENVDVLMQNFEESASRGLLSLMDEPQLMIPLWDHQREALEKWNENDNRGYVDMATATGKTVLGLGAVALQYGELHPHDQGVGGLVKQPNSNGSDDILIVAHSELILEQWRREFENHLNIPQERTVGSDIALEWGTVHFRTPQSLINEDRVTFDLVLLDEAHHYATGSEWGSLLDEFDGDVLAMSGSVDDAGSDSERIKDRLTNSIGPEIKRYTITEARADGVIPSFDWEIYYAPYDVVGDDLVKVATRSEQAFQRFQKRVNQGELSLDTERRLQTYEDVRRFSHTTEGSNLKQQDEEFRDLVTRLFSRRTKHWNLSPVLDAVVGLVVEHITTEKIVVLADSNAQVEELESRLAEIVDQSSIYLLEGSQSRSEQREKIEEFDKPEESGVLLGTGDLLGEGVDMQRASVAINMATGGVNPELVQRIGRVLRNPDDAPKHAMFYNVVGVPPMEAAAVPREDGKQIIEQAAGFCSLGRRIDTLPGFATAESVDTDVFRTILTKGAEFIETLDATGEYKWNEGIAKRDDLEALHAAARTRNSSVETILGEWEEYAWGYSEDDENSAVGTIPNNSPTEKQETAEDTDKRHKDDLKPETENRNSEPDPVRSHVFDLVRLQPTENSELRIKWDIPSGQSIEDYLSSELKGYFFRDSDNLIWASDEAEALVDEHSERTDESDAAIDKLSDDLIQSPSETDLLAEIDRLSHAIGRTPTEAQMADRGKYEVVKYREAFGTWGEAVQEAGLEPSGSQSAGYTREEVLSGIREVASNIDGPPSPRDINEYADFSAASVYTHFDSMKDAREAAGVASRSSTSRQQPYTRENVISNFQEIAADLGKPPSTNDINDHADFSAAVIYNFFDSITDARKAAGVDDAALGSSEGTETESGTEETAKNEEVDSPSKRGPVSERRSSSTPPNETDSQTHDVEPAKEPSSDEGIQSQQPTDSQSTGKDSGSATDQVIFWDRDAGQITEYEDAKTINRETRPSNDPLDKKIDEWKSQLLDLTRRNKLISFKPTKTKSLPFKGANPTTIGHELNNEGELYIRKQPDDGDISGSSSAGDNEHSRLATNEIIPIREVEETENSLYQIELRNKAHLRERGVDSLYLSLGMLRWYSVDHSDDANRSPLFLAPVELEQRTLQDGNRHNYVLKAKSQGLRLNPALRKKLAAERGIDLPADKALSLETIDAAFESVYETFRGFERWTIQKQVVLGIFDFTKFSLYSDLERNRDAVKDNQIIRALNGDTEPLREAERDIEMVSARELDDAVDPIETYQVLDADSSQQEAIEAAKRGKSFVLQGPPGTGKSQTIANIIAEKLADGERILFVSEKQAALDVVKNRLDDVGIGRFCLEVHGGRANKTDVLGSLEDEMKASQIKPAKNRAQRLRKLRKRRDTINQYGQNLFYSPDRWDLTAYQAFGIVSEHMDTPQVDIGIGQPLNIGQETFEEAIDELETLARFEDIINSYETGPWRHTTLTQWGVDTGSSMRRALDQQVDVIAELRETADEVEAALGIRPGSLSEFWSMNQVLQHVSVRPRIPWQEEFFDGSFSQERGRFEELAELEREREELITDLLEKYQRSFFSTNGVELNDELAGYGVMKFIKPSYRSLKRKVTNHTQDTYNPEHEQLLEDTRKLAEIQHIEDRRDDYQGVIQRLGPLYEGGDTDWKTLTQAQNWVSELDEFDSSYTEPIIEDLLDDNLPSVESLASQMGTELGRYNHAATFFEDTMAVREMAIGGKPLQQASFSKLSERLEALRNDISRLQRRVQFASQLETVRGTISGEYVDQFLHEGYSGNQLVPTFKKRFYTKWLNSVYQHTELGSFNADEMERYIEEFRRLDQEQQELARIEIQHEVTRRRSLSSLEHTSTPEQALVRRETEKQRRHKPLRELFDEAGSFITELTPCFMMSPLSVAQHLKTESIQFDTVVFDEASQIMPQDAVSSLIRADQAIIAGDTKQLPPTSFFQSDVETTEDVREDLDSILEETASVLPEKSLRWHYRSRDKELIQFSNYHYYNDSLRTFPENDPDIDTGVSFEYVSDGVYDRGGSRQNEVEAQYVIDKITDHAENHSEKSLGVVAFSSTQEQAIRDALEERRKENAILDAFVSQDGVLDEFFIKNLEMVQGDERDRMIFSVGYGPDQNGNIYQNFGPLNKSGGERRLNVAVTRAKEQITVVSSIRPGDIDLTRSNSVGVEHFKKYLEYAQDGERALARDDTVTDILDFDSQFEEAVYSALDNEGHDVVSQVQSSSYSIDLAIKHPDQPGKFVLGIECDGAAYHSSKTARDRDRTRQMVLEDLGWTIHRIWSPDWASNREREIQKINEKVDSLIGGETISTEPNEVPSHNAEVVEGGSRTQQEESSEYQEMREPSGPSQPSVDESPDTTSDKRSESSKEFSNSGRKSQLRSHPESAAGNVYTSKRSDNVEKEPEASKNEKPGNDESSTEQSTLNIQQSPEEVVSRADGDFSTKSLTKVSGRLSTKPLIDYLEPGEKLEYVFWHQSKGFRLIDSEGAEETPHHNSGSSYARFLLVTDQQLRYVAGQDEQDVTQVFPYNEIVEAKSRSSFGVRTIDFVTTDGTTYRFAEVGTHWSDVEPAVDYIQERLT